MRKMGIGLGVGINRSNYAQGIFNAYSARVVADGGVVESGTCVDAVSSLLQSASLLLIPSGYKGGKLYAEIPTNGNGDLTWTRTSTAIRTNSSGLLESMGSGVPRLSYMYGSCPSALLEPQRTNLALQSTITSFGTAGNSNVWINGTANPASINQTEGITGQQNGTKYTKTTGNTTQDFFYKVTVPVTSGTTYTVSGYIKLGTASNAVIVINNSSGWNTVSGGSIVCSTANGFSTSSWKRFQLTIVGPSTGTINVHYGYHQETGVTAQADGTFFLDGLQVEAGAYATTIIPTTSATATRVADSAVKTGIGSLIGQTEGVIYCDVYLDVRQSYTYFAIAPNLGSVSTYIGIGFNATTLQFEVVNSGVQCSISYSNSSTGRFKIAAAYKANDFVLYVNGAQIGTDTSGTVPTCSQIGLFNYDTSQSMRYNQVALFPTRLTNAELATLTTL